jgi:hypothetical protein
MSSLIKICDKPHNCLMKYNLGNNNNNNTCSIMRRKYVHLMKDSMEFTSAEMGRQMCTRLKTIRYFSLNTFLDFECYTKSGT